MRFVTGVRRRGSGLAAGQGSGKNVGLGARGPGLPSCFCVAAGEPLPVSVPLLSPVSCRTTGWGLGMFSSGGAGPYKLRRGSAWWL